MDHGSTVTEKSDISSLNGAATSAHEVGEFCRGSNSAKQLVAIQHQHPDQCLATRHERREQGARRAPKLLGPH
jgi:hypothetical protein